MNQTTIIGLIVSIAAITIIILIYFNKQKKGKKSKKKGSNLKQYEKAHHLTATIYYILAILMIFITMLALWPVINEIKGMIGG